MIAISLGNGIGDACGFLRLVALNADFDQTGVSDGPQIETLLEALNRLFRFEPLAAMRLLAPFFVELQFLDDLAQNNFGLDDFKLGLNEVGIVATRWDRVCRTGNIRLVP